MVGAVGDPDRARQAERLQQVNHGVSDEMHVLLPLVYSVSVLIQKVSWFSLALLALSSLLQVVAGVVGDLLQPEINGLQPKAG